MKALILTAVSVALLAAPSALAQTTFDCTTSVGVNCSAAIPDSNGLTDGVLISTFVVPAAACAPGGFLSAVVPSVDISHTWVGDLSVILRAPDGVTTSTLVSRPLTGTGSCASDDIVASFQDGAPAFACSPAIPANGVSPIAPATILAPFTTTLLTGTWTLEVRDAANSNIGSLNNWGFALSCGVPIVTITVIDPLGTEAGDPIVFQVTRSTLNPGGPLTVNIAFSGSATFGADYTAVIPVTIPNGQLSTTLTITPQQDADAEGAETVTATIQPAPAYTVGTPGAATGTIATSDFDIPTLSTMGMIAAALLLAAVALIAMRGGMLNG